MTVKLAWWQEGSFVIAPASGMEEHYDDICAGAVQFRFTVAVVEDSGGHDSRSFTIDNPSIRSRE